MQVQFAYFLLCSGLGFRPSGALILGGEEGEGRSCSREKVEAAKEPGQRERTGEEERRENASSASRQ